MDHVVDWKSSNKWHGKVLSLKFDGNSVLVGGMDTNIEVYNGWYDAFLLVLGLAVHLTIVIPFVIMRG